MPPVRQAPQYDPNAILTPVATPVDTYSGPEQNSMLQLAGALRDLNPALDNYIGVQKKVVDATDFQAGQLAYMKAKDNLKNAVDKGTIQPGFSPAFKRGYQQGQLRNLGLDYDQQLREAYSQSDAANSDDPSKFSGFLSDFTSQFIQKNGIVGGDFHPLDVGQAFTPGIDAAQHSLAAFHVEQRAKTVEDDWETNTQNEISTTIDNAHANNFTPEQMGGAVNDVITKAMANGWHDKKQFNRSVVDLVAAKAVGTGNAAMLDMLNHVPTGPGSTLGNTTYARDKALESTQRIQNVQRDNVRWDWAQQEHQFSLESHAWAQQEHARTQQDWAIQKNSGTLLRAMIAQTIQDPTKVTDAQITQLTNMDRDGSAARTYLAFRHSYLDGKAQGADDPNTVTSLYTKLYNNPQGFNAQDIIKAQAEGRLSMKTMQNMLDDGRRASEAGASPLLHDPVYTSLVDGVTKAFQGDPNEFDVSKVAKTTEARISFQRHALTYLAQHKDNLDPSAFYDEMQKYQQRLVKPLLDAEAAPAKNAKGQPQAQGKPNPYAQSGMAH